MNQWLRRTTLSFHRHVYAKRLMQAIWLLWIMAVFPAAAAADMAVLIEYIDVPANERDKFEQTVTNTVRQLNLDRKDNNQIFAWYHYRVRFPYGSGRDYSDVLVTVFTDFSSLERAEISAAYRQWVHRTEIYQAAPGIRSENYAGQVEFTHITVSFLHHGPDREKFLHEMRDNVKPMLEQKRIDGTVVNWSLFAKRLPDGNSEAYHCAVVARYNGFKHIENPLLDGPIARHLVKSECWELAGIVE